MTTVQAVSLGHAVDFTAVSAGVVHSAFARAVNIEAGNEFWTLLASDRPDLPFGIRTGEPDFTRFAFRPGNRVGIRGGFLGVASASQRHVVDCRNAARWRPSTQAAVVPGVAERLAIVAESAAQRAWPQAPLAARSVMDALDGRRDLASMLRIVVGCGPGSTPAGDDVLIGILAAATAPCAGPRGARAARLLSDHIPPLLSGTTDISAHLLRQAARGLFGRALHDLLDAIAAATPDWKLRHAVAHVLATGATSGADTCMGLLAAAPVFLTPPAERSPA